MLIEKNWRVLTIGDGDLSFSAAIASHHQPAALTATVFDDKPTLLTKYTENAFQQLQNHQVDVLFEFDVTKPSSWGELNKHSFDLVIFQFPLIPGFKSKQEYQEKCSEFNTNTLNRQLLRAFLLHSFEHFLDPNGKRLCYITSKDVKPYKEWNIENALHINTSLFYLGWHDFDIEAFPGYKVRNVDRDKHVKDTRGITYVWSDKEDHPLKKQLTPSLYQGEEYCELCASGPYHTEADKARHLRSKKHLNMLHYENLWHKMLEQQS